MSDATQLSCVARAFAALRSLTDDELATAMCADVATVRRSRAAPNDVSSEERQHLVAVLRQHGLGSIATELEIETNAAAWFNDRMKKALADGLSPRAARERVIRELEREVGSEKAATVDLLEGALKPSRES